MKNVDYKSLVADKISDLKKQINVLKTNDTLSKNTRGTQLYKLGRERRVLHLIDSLINKDTKLEGDDLDTFVLITTLASERVVHNAVEVKEGDSILELMQKYQERKDLQKKLTVAAEKSGLKLDYTTGKVVKA